MIKHFVICLVVLAAIGAAPGSAGETKSTVTDHALTQAAAGQTIFAEFLLGAASAREKTAQRELIAKMEEWLATSFGLPHAPELPLVTYVPSSSIAALRYKGLSHAPSTDVTASIPQASLQTTVAIYVDAEKTIYLPEEWTGQNPAELSVLVHEMVHHMQLVGGLHYECLREREKLAYAAQDKFLQLFGRSLASDFELDPFTILVRSTCAY